MNILRLRRKGKKVNAKRYLFLLFSLIMTTFAWFAYTKVLDTDLNLKMISWDIKFFVNGVEKGNPLDIAIQELYPGMEDKVVDVVIENNGEANATVEYSISELSLLGTTYTLVSNPAQVTSDTHLYIPGATVVDGVATQDIINDPTRFPFKLDIVSTPQIVGESEGYLKIRLSWPGDNDVLDTKWGYDTGVYYNSGVITAQPLKLSLKLNAVQIQQ